VILLKNCTIYDPQFLGTGDILTGGGRILLVDQDIVPNITGVAVLDVNNRTVLPGLMDSHIHIAGAGGEGGPATRTTEMDPEAIVSAGITSVVGCLGTDGITRSVRSVLMKAKSLKQYGLSAWIYTGSYQVPPPTITGDIAMDIALIEEVIGTGEIALGDHRSSLPEKIDFARLARTTRLGGLLGNKAGVVNIHLGDQGDPFGFIEEVIREFQISSFSLIPTHCNRSRKVFDRAKNYSAFGYIDLTTSSYEFYKEIEIKPSDAFHEMLEEGIPPERISMSTDSGGSLPVFNKKNEFLGSEAGDPNSLFREIRDIFSGDPGNRELNALALRTVTSNVARNLKLGSKGGIRAGKDADLVILDEELNVDMVMGRGRWMMKEKIILK